MESIGMNRNGQANSRTVRFPGGMQPANENKLPPHNLEAELSLIGSCLWDNEQIDVVEKICKPEHFYREVHERVYRRILKLRSEGTPVDAVTLGDDLEKLGLLEYVGGNDFFTEATAIVPHALNARMYAWIVRQKARMRGVIEEMSEMLRRAYNQHEDPADVLDDTIRRLEVLREEKDEDAPTPIKLLPQSLADDAFIGPAAEAAEMIEPDCECSIEGLLVQLLVTLGNEFGPKPHWSANTTRHPCNEFVCIVGPTSTGRKNTSNDVTEWLIQQIQDRPERRWRPTGLTSGEGLIQAVIDEGGPVLFFEDEFDAILAKMGREGNTLSSELRKAWNGPNLGSKTRANALKATNAYVSLIAATNYDDLGNAINKGMLTSGLANRFLWINVYQARLLPMGGDQRAVIQRLQPLLPSFREAIDLAKRWDERIPSFFTADAQEYWEYLYKGPFVEPRIGAWGKVTQRRAPHCRRLALIYALLDSDTQVGIKHLKAAKAIIDYSDATAAVIFAGGAVEEEETKIIHAFKADRLESKDGWTRTQINRKCWGGHKAADELDRLLSSLHRSGLLEAAESTKNSRLVRLWKLAKLC
jgi:hypothetical protein